MGRILAIDFGTKRIGLAITDPLQLIGSPLETVQNKEIFNYLKKYLKEEDVDCIVVGDPMYPDGNPAQIAPQVHDFIKKLQKLFPEIPVEKQDERYTSVDAKEIILQSGAKKKKRRDKSNVDKVSASLILEAFMKSEGKW